MRFAPMFARRAASRLARAGALLAVCVAVVAPTVAAPATGPSKPLAVEEMDNGLKVEVTRVARTHDGFVEVRWRYVNPTAKPVILWHAGGGRHMLNELYLVDPANKVKHGVVTLKKDQLKPGSHTMLAPAMIGDQIEIEPHGSCPAWAKFAVPAGVGRVNFVHPGSLPPMEDLDVAAAAATERPQQVPGEQNEALVSQPHLYPPGPVVEVTRVRRTSDGFLEVRWRYVNPTDKPIILWYAGGGKILVDGLFIVDRETHAFAHVARDDKGQPYSAQADQTELKPGGTFGFWAKFSVPRGAKHVTLYGLGTYPVEDLSTQAPN
jgi:hypothetical protein